MALSGAAITYLVDRMMASGHITRQSDPATDAKSSCATRNPASRPLEPSSPRWDCTFAPRWRTCPMRTWPLPIAYSPR
jgi:hypothetical protein